MIVIIHSLNPSFAQKFCSSAHFGGHFEKTTGAFLHSSLVEHAFSPMILQDWLVCIIYNG